MVHILTAHSYKLSGESRGRKCASCQYILKAQSESDDISAIFFLQLYVHKYYTIKN